jgi:hypothetical protein
MACRASDPPVTGQWSWVVATSSGDTHRVESEDWQILTEGRRTVGRYLRTVTVTSTDDTPFLCNQQARYRQRAAFDVDVTPTAHGLRVRELGYQTEPSPCDPGFRQLGDYLLSVGPTLATLSWERGAATLLRTGPAPARLADVPWTLEQSPIGQWQWSAKVGTAPDAGFERQAWTVVARAGEYLDINIDRTFPGSARAPGCSGDPVPTVRERILVEGLTSPGGSVRLRELSVDTSPPCASGDARVLDSGTATRVGDYWVIQWRGNRRQVLHRP